MQGKLGRAQFSNWLCYELTGACTKKPPPLPKDRAPGQAFQVIDPQEAQMQKMMAGMKVWRRSFHLHLGFVIQGVGLLVISRQRSLHPACHNNHHLYERT